jgi:hypothetical protein
MEEYVGVHTRRKVERIKQKGEAEQKWEVGNQIEIKW